MPWYALVILTGAPLGLAAAALVVLAARLIHGSRNPRPGYLDLTTTARASARKRTA